MRAIGLLLAAALTLQAPTLALGAASCARVPACCRKGAMGCPCPLHCHRGTGDCSARSPQAGLAEAPPAVPPAAAGMTVRPQWAPLRPLARRFAMVPRPQPPVPPPRG